MECCESCPVAKLEEQTEGMRASKPSKSGSDHGGAIWGSGKPMGEIDSYEDSAGNASRFYPQAGWEHEEMECCEACPVARLDEQAGERPSSARPQSAGNFYSANNHVFGQFNGKEHHSLHDDSGGVSRYYPNADWQHEVAEQLAQADPVHYCPKSAKRERNNGLDDFYWKRDKDSPTGFVRITKEEWEALDKRQRAKGNIHSTVKPLSLLKWLAALLLPPPEYAPRRILIPFSGSGSEAIAAALVGFEEVMAVEMLRDYCDIAETRAAFWLTRQLELPA
jgi:hypothetical protein